MLKAVVETDQSLPAIPSIKHLLRRISVEHGILLDDLPCFDALVTSLTQDGNWTPNPKTISFFDNCASRIARQPVQYGDLAADENSDNAAICLLASCIAEQWPFATEIEGRDDQDNLAEWISRLFVLLIHAGEERDELQKLHIQIVDATNDPALSESLQNTYQTRLRRADAPQQLIESEKVVDESNPLPNDESRNIRNTLETAFEPQPRRTESVGGLERLNQNDLEALVANGRLSSLCRTLSSSVEETRRQGFVALQRITKQIVVL
jgi:nucleolar pre-ribosomal-associated protein 1